MAGNKSNAFSTAFLNYVLRAGAWPRGGGPNATNRVALFAGATDATMDDGTAVEVAGNGYARVGIAAAGWVNPTTIDGKTTRNVADITFPQCAGGNWGNITHAAIFDEAAAGNRIWWGALASPRNVLDGDTFMIPAGELEIVEP